MNHIVCRLGLVLLAVFCSCDDFLDKMPDNRIDPDYLSPDQMSKMLVSAYAQSMPVCMHELMSDNVDDYGQRIDVVSSLYEESYQFKDILSDDTDSPSAIWSANYSAIAAANTVLEAIDQQVAEGGNPADFTAQKGEALLCRAYAHFTLCNTFCQAYNPQTSTTDLGIPYVEKPEKTVYNQYDRGTVAGVYEKIARDIEEGLPLIDDTKYTQPKYHFNTRAAHAFAAQFYLYYLQPGKSVRYADEAIGDDPTPLFRNWQPYMNDCTSSAEYTNVYVASEENANFFMQGFTSLYQRSGTGRYVLTFQLLGETLTSAGPWGQNGMLPYGVTYKWNGGGQGYFLPVQDEYFMYTDEVAGIGHPYLVQVVFSVEKTLIDRAEAHAMLKEYDLAARDLNWFIYQADYAERYPEDYINDLGEYDDQYYEDLLNNDNTAEDIAEFYADGDPRYSKPLAPRFDVEPGMQTQLINACLHARRIADIHTGVRLQDLKRYGIAYQHIVDGGTNIQIEPYDKRLAIQIPEMVVAAGMEKNPR